MPYFLFEWEDSRASRTHDVGNWPDACAVAFSLAEEPPSRSIMMGFQSPVNIWEWKADLDAQVWTDAPPGPAASTPNVHYTYEQAAEFPDRTEAPRSACQDLLAGRPGTVTRKPTTTVAGRGQWQDGRWRVIVKRSLTGGEPEEDAQLEAGKHYLAFALWDGEKGDRGARKSISDWVVMDVQPAGKTRATAEGPAPAASTPPAGFSLVPAAEGGTVAPEDEKAPEPRVITIKAKRFEYNPSEIKVEKGERITLRLESLDVTHGLYLDGYGIDIKANPTEVGVATFVADKPGRYTFRCSETCGEFHPYMTGYLTVTPNSRFHLYVIATVALGAVVAAVVLLRPGRKKGAE